MTDLVPTKEAPCGNGCRISGIDGHLYPHPDCPTHRQPRPSGPPS